MNSKILFVLLMSILVVGCADNVPQDASMEVAMERSIEGSMKASDCEEYYPIPGKCKDVGHPPEVTLNTNTLRANPPNVCANRGETITFKITPKRPNKDKKSVSIMPKELTNTWLVGSNSSDENKIEISIPTWVEPKENYDYGFAVAGPNGKCVDPRVHVEN